MKSLLALFLMASFPIAHAAMVKLEDVKDRGFNNQTASLIKNKAGAYELRVVSMATFDGNSNVVSENGRGEISFVTREIIVPVKINLEINGIDKNIQVGGSSDADAKMGTFANLEGKKIESLFEEFDGTSFNVGILLLGGGHSKASNRDNITFKDTNVSMIVGPSGSMGLNLGLSDYSFKLKMAPVLKAAEVRYSISYYVGENLRGIVDVFQVKTLDQVRAISLEK
ncbi:MAG: hypothetical protein H7177_05860 [Rhizobacter sp.]|nr:hypothetical protein [Bacteriovorax sp.]